MNSLDLSQARHEKIGSVLFCQSQQTKLGMVAL
jgi:hypothetical protein